MIEISIFQLSILFLIILAIIKYPRRGPNEPPLVPYKIPIIGHTFSYIFNSNKFLKECKEQYGDCFSLYVFGRVMTILARDTLNEMFRNTDKFDFITAIHEDIPLHQFLIYNGGMTEKGNQFNAKTAREQFSGKLEANMGTVQKYLSIGMDKWIGDCDEPTVFYDVWNLVNEIIALPVANILVGEEAGNHDDLVHAFGRLAFDIGHLLVIPPILSFVHQKLHEFIITLPMRFGLNPVKRHRRVVMNRLKPVIEKRLRERIKLGDSYKPYDDLLEYYMSQPDFDYFKPNNFPYYVDNLFIMVFAAIHTTSRTASIALFDIGARPELLEELYEEASRIDRECNGKVSLADAKRMVKLDSLVKESLRHNDNAVVLPHYVRPESYTFSNGYTVPRGRKVIAYIEDTLMAKEHYGEDAEVFDALRFVNKNSPATKVERSYIVFGSGKHACPGRFFAINEVKLFLHKFLLRYKVSTKSGKVDKKFYFGQFALPPRSGIIIDKRVPNN